MHILLKVAVLMVLASPVAFGRKLPELNRPGKGEELPRVNFEKGLAPETSQVARRGNSVKEANQKATISQVVETCVGGCELPLRIENIVYENGLGLEAMTNAYSISTRAKELVEAGLDGEAATRLATTELGLSPERIKRDCP